MPSRSAIPIERPARRALRPHLPLVYACSGCSGVAQVANAVAVRLDREGIMEMSCIAGVGGNVPALVRRATSGRPILAIDGCALQCVRSCLAQHQVEPTRHLLLSDEGLAKNRDGDYDADVVERVYQQASDLAEELETSAEARAAAR